MISYFLEIALNAVFFFGTNKESWTFSFGMKGVCFNLFVSSYLKKLLLMQVSYVPEEINGD